jgi:hypothetical protein
MRLGKQLIVIGIVLAVVGVVVWAGVGEGTSSGSQQWEYGVFVGGPIWNWYGPSGSVDHANAQDFARAMGAAYSTQATAFEASVLNALGARGWELVTVAERSKYILRRPR